MVLFGTDSTQNPLEQDDQYQNITVHRHLMVPDFELLEEIENQVQPDVQQADCILSQNVSSLIFEQMKWRSGTISNNMEV